MVLVRKAGGVNALLEGSTTIGAPGTIQDVWPVGGIADFSLADGPLTIVSDDINDTLLGSGARKIKVTGNTAGAKPMPQTVEYDMDGDQPFVTPQSFQGMSISSTIVSDSNDHSRTNLPTGTITITQGGTTVALLSPGPGSLGNASYNGFRRIPYSASGEVETWRIGVGQASVLDLAGQQNAAIQFTLWKKKPGSQFFSLGALPLEAAIETRARVNTAGDFVSGDIFAARVVSEVAGVQVFVSASIETFTEIPGHYQAAYETGAT